MNIDEIAPLPGIKCAYDYFLESRAQKHLEFLRRVAALPAWKKWILRSELPNAPYANSALFFISRNSNDPLAKELDRVHILATGKRYDLP